MKFINALGEIYLPKSFLSYNDVLLRPQRSRFDSRNSPNITTSTILGDLTFKEIKESIKFNIPIISANMDTVTGKDMVIEMHKLGGLGILHRFYKDQKRYVEDIIDIHRQIGYAPFSIGAGSKWITFLKDLYKEFEKAGILHPRMLVRLDVAHGHMEISIDTIREISTWLEFPVFIMAGNVATADGARDLVAAGAHSIFVGCGSGAVCSTRIVTGHGVPQLSAIMEVKRAIGDTASIVADGGISSSGDIVKALAAGANAVMIGNLLAGHEECPGEIVDGCKVYRGQSSRHFLDDQGKTGVASEGEAVRMPLKGKVENTIKELVGGIRSGFTYSGCGSISELQRNAEFVEITNHGWVESTPHAITKDGRAKVGA